MSSVDSFIVNLAFPYIGRDTGPNSTCDQRMSVGSFTSSAPRRLPIV